MLIKTEKKIRLIGDKSLSKRDFSRVTKPLKLFGANIKSNNKKAFDMKFCNSCRSYISYDYEFGFNCKINNCPWS